MIARFEFQFRQQSRLFPTAVERTKREFHPAALLIGGFSLLFVLWIIYRLFIQPAWVEQIPSLLREMLSLVETAASVTLVILWFVWRWYRSQPPRLSVPTLDVDQLYALSPAGFEKYVASLFRFKGYKVKLRGRSGDLGVDLELTQPGGRRAIVQCKRYRSKIGPEIVRELYGTLIHEEASHAFLVTTAEISESSRDWALDKPITLIDGGTLVEIVNFLQNRNMS